MNYIKRKIPTDELLAGLAEEAAELAQAALKLRRVFTKVNPTPIKEDEAIERLYEEMADVQLYCSLLDVNPSFIKETMHAKTRRWEERLKEKDNAENDKSSV